MGTTISMILLSNRTEYNGKLNVVIHLASVAFFKTLNVLKWALSWAADVTEPLLRTDSSAEVLQQSEIYYVLLKWFCLTSDFMQELCLSIAELFIGRDREQFDFTEVYTGVYVTSDCRYNCVIECV